MAARTANSVSSIFRPNLFSGKVAIVTGGGTGIGKAITQELLFLGCKVMIAARNEDRLKRAAEEFYLPPESSATVACKQCNIRQEKQVKELISHTLSKFGHLDFLVNNSGGQFRSASSNLTHGGWSSVIDLNLTGTFLICREAYNQWMKDHGGSIVNILLGFWNGRPLISHSSAARAGVDNLTKSLAIEWADSGVRVNSVAPSSVYTETAAAVYGESAFTGIVQDIPAKRVCTVEEVSASVCYLLSPAAAYVSGVTIRVDGGLSLYTSKGFQIPDHNKNQPYKWIDDMKSRL